MRADELALAMTVGVAMWVGIVVLVFLVGLL